MSTTQCTPHATRGRRSLPWLLLATLSLATGCGYDASQAPQLEETRNLVDDSVEQEVKRIKALFEKSAPRFEGKSVSLPIPDAFNDTLDPNEVKQPAYGGRVRIALNTEPKRMNSFMDSSASTAEINRYIFNGLLYVDPDTLEIYPDLATHWETEDVIWLKGRHEDSIFERKFEKTKPDVENNYVIGKVQPESLVWADPEQKVLQAVTVLVAGQPVTYTGDQLRLESNADGSYKRYFDRGVVFTFHLRSGVKFHDDQPMSADDVTFTLDVINNPKIPELTPIRSAYASVRYWEKLDASTVKIYLNEQYFGATELFADSFNVLPRHVFIPDGTTFTEEEFAKHFRDHPMIDKPVGTGPYAMPSSLVKKSLQDDGRESWERGNYARLIRTGEFWDPYRRGYLDEVIFNFYSGGGDVILRAINNNESDFTRYLGSEELFKKSNNPAFKEKYAKTYFFGPSYGFFSMNIRKPYFADKRVRQAFNYVLNRQRFSDNVSYGIAIPISGQQFNFGPFYNPNIPAYPYDRKKAEELLNESGWVDTDGDGLRDKDGIPMEIDILLSTGKGNIGEGLGLMMKEDFESMGVKLNFRRLEWASLLKHIDDRKFDLYSLSYQSDIESDPYPTFHSSQWANEGQNTGGYNNPEADRLMEQIRRELDTDRRRELHWKLQEMLHEDAASIFLFNYPNRGAYDRRLRNVKFGGKRPGYFAWQWYIPEALQTDKERARAKERWKDLPVQPLVTAAEGSKAGASN